MMSNPKTIRIATRASQLAMAQAEMVRDTLLAHEPDLDITLLSMTTSGDQNQTKDLAQWGYKGLFTKEIEEALLSGEADIAVHSMKDMPSILPDGLMIAAMLEREDPRDAFVSKRYASLDELPEGATLGTSSVRRGAIIRNLRPDLQLVPFRGNVNTRLQKLTDGVADATLLAVAGLKRLGFEEHITQALSDRIMLPAVAQGAIGIECLSNNNDIVELLSNISHTPTVIAINAERAVLAALDGSCKTPLSGYATLNGDTLHLRATLTHPDGSQNWSVERFGALSDAPSIGEDAGEELRNLAGDNVELAS